jgi:hypothetical protein
MPHKSVILIYYLRIDQFAPEFVSEFVFVSVVFVSVFGLADTVADAFPLLDKLDEFIRVIFPSSEK